MKVAKESNFILFLVTIVRAFVAPPSLQQINPSLVFDSLYTENVNLYATNKTSEELSFSPNRSFEISHRKFLEYPRSRYVDKTLFIRDVFHDNPQHITIISRPRGFGKTLALSSLYYFCDCHFKNATTLFSGLQIMERDPILNGIRKEFMSKYPVIWIDFATIKYATFEQNFKEINRIIGNIFRLHKYILDSETNSRNRDQFQKLLRGEGNEKDIILSIAFLSQRIFDQNIGNYYPQPILLIDNYDVPFHTGYKHNHYKEMESFLFRFYRKSTGCAVARKVIITSVTGIKETVDFYFTWGSGRESVVMDAPFSQHFGFTSKEVEQLLKQSGSDISMETLIHRYGGYSCETIFVFNPLSVVNEIYSQKSYKWAETESKEQLGKFIIDHGLYPVLTIQQLLLEGHVYQDLSVDVNFLEINKTELYYWSYLAHSGYVTAIKQPWMEKGYGELRIPNLEVRNRIESLIRECCAGIPLYTEFTDLLINGNYSAARVFILAYIQKSGEYLREDDQGYDVEKLRGYVKRMLRGVEIFYNTTMKITYKPNVVTMEIEADKARGEPVMVTVEKVVTWGESWDRLQNKTCSVKGPQGGRKTEIIIMAKRKEVDVCIV